MLNKLQSTNPKGAQGEGTRHACAKLGNLSSAVGEINLGLRRNAILC